MEDKILNIQPSVSNKYQPFFTFPKNRFKLIAVFVLSISASFAQTVQLHGYVKDASTKEALVGVNITLKNQNTLVQSNNYGFFSLQLTANKRYQIIFSSVGFQNDTLEIVAQNQNKMERPLRRTDPIDVYLKPLDYQLDEVVVEGNREPSKTTQISTNTLTPAEIKTIPLIFGEKDPIKAFQLLPGVQQASEGSSMFLVRGGGADQNLLLLDQATVYNANHLFGFISTFNADPIKHIELYKGGFPARYGGRLSSVLDVRMKEGSSEGFHGEVGIGLITSRLTLEGPIVKKKASFLFSARRTYFDAIKFLVPTKGFSVNYHFYDLNAKLNWQINPKNSLYLSLYTGSDKLAIDEGLQIGLVSSNYQYGMNWGNVTSTLRWSHVFSEKLFANTSAIWTKYNFELFDKYSRQIADDKYQTETDYLSSIRDLSLKTDFDYFANLNTTIRWGGVFTQHSFNPQILKVGTETPASTTIDNAEWGFYAEYESKWTEKLSSNLGLRLNSYHISSQNSRFFEPRAVLSYQASNTWTLKASYARTSQFTHQLSNTGVGFPTDLWVPATEKVPIASAQQVSGAIEKKFRNGYSLVLETYYKKMTNVVSYKETNTFVNVSTNQETNFWENKLTSGQGWAYGYEVLLKKNSGKLRGWIGYTLGWSIRQFPDLNGGQPFYSRQDRRHDFELVATYSLKPSIRLSANWIYTTGNPITAPLASFATFKNDRVGLIDYGAMNIYRTPSVHRLDLGIQFYRKRKYFERYWEIGLYNAYNRQNPFYYSVETIENSQTNTLKYELRSRALFPIVPSVGYNVKF
jgi:hypothetical protein